MRIFTLEQKEVVDDIEEAYSALLRASYKMDEIDTVECEKIAIARKAILRLIHELNFRQ